MEQTLKSGALVGAYLRGDLRAFDELFYRYAGRLRNFIQRMIGDRERAEDLVQEAFFRAHRHLARFDQTKQFSTWLYTIASNLARNEIRNRRRGAVLLGTLSEISSIEDGMSLQWEDSRTRPDEMYRRRSLADAVRLTMSRLPERHREAFVMRELEGRSYEEIAALTGSHLGTVKSRLNRARRSFAAAIEPYLD